jgi:hypothetical protein
VTRAIPFALAAAGILALVGAIVNERRMQRHRQPGVTYAQVTWRRDGAWRRADLFTPRGLELQRRASTFGVTGAALLVLALAVWGVGAIYS